MRIVASVHWLNVHPSPHRKLGKQIVVKQIIKYWIRAPPLVINPGKIALIAWNPWWSLSLWCTEMRYFIAMSCSTSCIHIASKYLQEVRPSKMLTSFLFERSLLFFLKGIHVHCFIHVHCLQAGTRTKRGNKNGSSIHKCATFHFSKTNVDHKQKEGKSGRGHGLRFRGTKTAVSRGQPMGWVGVSTLSIVIIGGGGAN